MPRKKKDESNNGRPNGAPKPEPTNNKPMVTYTTTAEAIQHFDRTLEQLIDVYSDSVKVLGDMRDVLIQMKDELDNTDNSMSELQGEVSELSAKVSRQNDLLDTVEYRLSQQGLYRNNGVPAGT